MNTQLTSRFLKNSWSTRFRCSHRASKASKNALSSSRLGNNRTWNQIYELNLLINHQDRSYQPSFILTKHFNHPRTTAYADSLTSCTEGKATLSSSSRSDNNGRLSPWTNKSEWPTNTESCSMSCAENTERLRRLISDKSIVLPLKWMFSSNKKFIKHARRQMNIGV